VHESTVHRRRVIPILNQCFQYRISSRKPSDYGCGRYAYAPGPLRRETYCSGASMPCPSPPSTGSLTAVVKVASKARNNAATATSSGVCRGASWG
jgi:hypothetical protein